MKTSYLFPIKISEIVNSIDEYNHALSVANRFVEGSPAWKIGLIHDLVEDNYITFNKAKFEFDLTSNELDALIAITRNKGEKYFDYIERVSKNNLAILVKLADLEHNIYRCKQSGNESLLKRYLKAKEILESNI